MNVGEAMTEISKLGLQTSAEAKIFYAAFLSNAEDILTQAETKAIVEKYGSVEHAFRALHDGEKQ
jgi:hypothetical protein